jgi:hypothetical protein
VAEWTLRLPDWYQPHPVKDGSNDQRTFSALQTLSGWIGREDGIGVTQEDRFMAEDYIIIPGHCSLVERYDSAADEGGSETSSVGKLHRGLQET